MTARKSDIADRELTLPAVVATTLSAWVIASAKSATRLFAQYGNMFGIIRVTL